MNLFNRIAMTFLVLLGTVFSVALIFASLLFPQEAIASVGNTLIFVDENLTLGLQILVASVAAIGAVVGFLLLLLEVVPRSAKGVRLTAVTGASAQLTIEAIVNRIRYETEALSSVRQVKPVVTSRGKEIDVDLDLRTDPTIDVAAKTEEASQVVRDTVENKMGIKLRRLRVFVQHDPYPKDFKGKAPGQPNPAKPTSSTDTL